MGTHLRAPWPWVAFVTAFWATAVAAEAPPRVVSVAPGKAAAAAGLLPGDRPLRWRTSGSAPFRPVVGIWGWHRLENCDGMLGLTELEVRRGGRLETLRLSPSAWGVTVRPEMPPAPARACEAVLSKAAAEPALAADGLERLAAAQPPGSRAVWYLFQASGLFMDAKDPTSALRCIRGAQERAGKGAEPLVLALLNYRAGRVCDAAGKPDEAAEALGAMAERARELPDGGTLAALALDLRAGSRMQAGDLKSAEAAAEAAVGLWSSVAPDSLLAAQAFNTRGTIAYRRSRYEEARGFFERALALRQRLQPEGLEVAASLNSLGMVAHALGEGEEEERLLLQGLALRERAAPESLALASSYLSLSTMYYRRGDLDAAEDYARRSLVLRERLAPESLSVADVLLNLGVVQRNRGDLAGAEETYRRALALRMRLAPASTGTADLLGNLGEVARERGDYAGAESLHRESLVLRQRAAPGSIGEARSLHNLGFLALHQGDYENGRKYLTQALALKLKLTPKSPEVCWTRHNLALLELEAGDPQTAITSLEEVVAQYETVEPDGLSLAAAVTDLGHARLKVGDLAGAEAEFTRAEALKRAKAPGSLLYASSLMSLAEVREAKGDLAGAADLLQQALALRRRLAPGSKGETENLGTLARVRRAQGRDAEAAGLYLEALDSLERQGARLGGTKSTLTDFRTGMLGLYQESLETLAHLGRAEEAFAVLERSRARVLLDMLAERDLQLGAEGSGDLDRQRKVLEAARETLYGELEGLSPETDASALEALKARLAEVQGELARVREGMVRAAPRLASLRYPRPLDAAAARATLAPGTLLLAYACGPEETVLFAMTAERSAVEVHRLPIADHDLARQVRRFRSLLAARLPVEVPARELGRLLLGPVSRDLKRCRRVVVLPDGPLHLLPFAALPDPASRGAAYLGTRKPLSTVLSTTLSAEFAAERGQVVPERVVAFGDPALAPDAAERLPALPNAREEVGAVERSFPGRTDVRIGADATEASFLKEAAGAGLVHVACHGLLDGRHPLDSALVLAPGAGGTGDDGRLHAWEVFERLRTPSRLVVLSACDTGLGLSAGGEGLVGLTRAFQYAGARAVMATLWSVPDRSACELSASFYAALAAGSAPDEALRRAQADAVARGGESAHPYYWAFFQIAGEGEGR